MASQIFSFTKYGISKKIAEGLISKNLTISIIKASSLNTLVSKFQLEDIVAIEIKKLTTRKAIKKEVLDNLLLNNCFICCCCIGQKGDSFLVHHIEPYENTQDNSYDNLAVLCPTCHDLAHAPRALSQGLTKSQIKKAKIDWELKCKNKRNNLPDIQIQPIVNAWEFEFETNEDQVQSKYLIELSVFLTNGINNCSFSITYLNRGNIFMAGEFSFPENSSDSDIKIFYWDVQWGHRVSEKKLCSGILNLDFDNEMRLITLNSDIDFLPYIITFKPIS